MPFPFHRGEIVVRNSSDVRGGRRAFLHVTERDGRDCGHLSAKDGACYSMVRVVEDTPANRKLSGGFYTPDWDWHKE